MCRIGPRSRASARRYWRRSTKVGRSPDKTNPREPVWRAQARRRACVAGRIGRETRFPEFSRQSGIAVLVFIVERNLAIPAGRIGGLWAPPIGAQCEIEFEGLAFVLQAAAGPQIGVVVEIIEGRIEHELANVLAVQ